MARPPQSVPMNIGSGRTTFFKVPQKVIDYFGLGAAVVAGTTTAVTRERKAHVRRKFNSDEISGVTADKPISVGVSRWQDVGGRARGGRGVGKLIKVPTEVPYDAANRAKGFRLVSLRVPSGASNYCIAMWINTTFTQHKPAYFLTPSGQQYPVAVPTVADPNPGNGTPTAATPAA